MLPTLAAATDIRAAAHGRGRTCRDAECRTVPASSTCTHFCGNPAASGIARRVPGYECEVPDVTAVNLDVLRIRRRSILNGLINEYSRAA
jgi:hypothetical protein